MIMGNNIQCIYIRGVIELLTRRNLIKLIEIESNKNLEKRIFACVIKLTPARFIVFINLIPLTLYRNV